MSFRLKTILLFLTTSLIPYLLIIFYIVNSTKNEILSEIEKDLDFSVELMGERIDKQIDSVYKDFIFISKLDIMDDIASLDLDKRITNLLKQKKEDIKLSGDFFVVDLQQNIIASSDMQMISRKFHIASDDAEMFAVDIIGSYNNAKIGTLYLKYDYENFRDILKAKSGQMVYLLNLENSKYIFKTKELEEPITQSKNIAAIKHLKLFVSIDKKQSLSLYSRFGFVLFWSLLAGMALISAVSIYFASKITKPINNLSSTALSIATTKNYSQRVELDSKDEIGKLATAFNQLIESIENALGEIELQNKQKLRLIEEKSKNEMFKALSHKLSKYLSPQIYRSIFEGEQDVKLESKRKKLTIFFSDIVNFTATTESMESEDLSQILNHYLNEMSLIALKYGATIDKFIGDAILIFFGDPRSNGVKADAIACLGMSIDMINKLYELEGYWQGMGIPKPFKIRIGINTGFCTVGNFGSEDRMDYTIIGGAVNLTSRIESKANPNEIWISQETYLLIKDEIYCEEIESIVAKGITHPIKIYKVVDFYSNLHERQMVENKLEGLTIHKNKIEISDKKIALESLRGLVESIEATN